MAHEPDPQLAALFPELRAWNDGGGITVSDWMGTFGSIPQAIAYSTLFSPEFVEYEGCILRRDFHPANFEAWMLNLGGDKTRAELVINHVHLTDFFLNTEEPTSAEQVDYLGRLLQDIWTIKLQHDFPLSGVQVDFFWNDRNAFEDAQLTVYRQRS